MIRLMTTQRASDLIGMGSGLRSRPTSAHFKMFSARLQMLGVALGLGALGSSLVIGAESETGAKLEFNRQIRPILSENCFPCHGPDKNHRKGKLRLDDRAVALEKEAIKPGHPDASNLVKRIYTTNEDDMMPPPEANKRLTPAQKDLLKRWIAEGAEYQPHWSYIKPARAALPVTRNPAWVRNAVDAFILHDLEEKNLAPSPEADRRTLIRRVSLDLIGLPPTPEEVAAFVNDTGSRAYEHVVDRLLASPHFGERMAVPWLDLARFTDTVGYHGDQNQRIYPYRDYVIDAFNRNEPFDQFTIEQLAGDLLPRPSTAALIATGFNRLNMMTREGGAQPKEYLAKYAADRVRTVATTWLGSTMGCCECHDHKFDPFWTKDFYSMEAFFADVKQWGVYQTYNYTPNPDLKDWSNDHPFPPELAVESPFQRARLERFQTQIDGLVDKASERLKRDAKQEQAFKAWRTASAAFFQAHPDGWLTPAPVVKQFPRDGDTSAQLSFEIQTNQSILLSGKSAARTEVKLALPAGSVSAVRVELLPHQANGGTILLDKAESTLISLSAKLKQPGEEKEQSLRFYFADADPKEDRYANGASILGIQDGWKTAREVRNSPQSGVWLLDKPVRIEEGAILTLTLGRSEVGCVRLSVSPFAPPAPAKAAGYLAQLRKSLADSSLGRSRAGRRFLTEAFLVNGGVDDEAFAQWKKAQREVLAAHDGRAFTMVTVAQKPLEIRVLPRGNWQDQSGAVVEPAVPHFLPQVTAPPGERLTRLDLAKWLVSRDNPLTARTEVNRLWKQFFGAGLSAVVDDLGAQGEWPLHPELLDWLAVDFMESGWNVKQIIKTMVMSATYRQVANPSPVAHEADPANRWLASQSPRRLEAEFVRDNALAIAGVLNLEIGGPSAHPYQPPGYYANLQFPDRDYYADKDQEQYRRGVYAHWQRTFLQPMLANFDAPAREECVASRNVSNTPQQALTLLNDPTFYEAARVFAARLLAAHVAGDDQRLELAYERALARPIKPRERESLTAFLASQREHFRANPAEAKLSAHVGIAPEPAGADEAELAAWTEVCRVVLNLHETITRY